MARVFAREVQHKGLASISMAIAVACYFFQDSGNRPEVGGVENHVEGANPSLIAISAGQGEGDYSLVGHIVADSEGKGIVKADGSMGVYGSNCGRALRNSDICCITTQGGSYIVGRKVAYIAEANVEVLVLSEVDLPIGVVEGVAVEEYMGAVGVIEADFKVLRPAVHARDIEVKDIVVVDGSKTQFGLAVGIGGGQGDQFIAFEKSAFKIINTFTAFDDVKTWMDSD